MKRIIKGPRRNLKSPEKDPKLKIIVLGGLEEVGRNMTLFEYQNDIIIVDLGLQFPEEDMPGIDYIIPNTSYLKGKEKNIRGIIISHPHYDHLGAIPHIMDKIGNPPIYGTDITLAIINRRQEDYKSKKYKLDLRKVKNDTRLAMGQFRVEFFGVSHNTPGSLGVIIRTPVGIVIHTGDFKIDDRSKIAGTTDLVKLARLANEKPLLLMSDSTNARETGKQSSEADISHELEDIIKNAPGRLIFGTFASLLGRLGEIIQLAAKHKKKVIIEGRSMRTNVEIASQLGYIKIPKNTIISADQIKRYPSSSILVLATGAQGEDNAVMMRIANNEHRFIKIQKDDTFVFSSSVVPGNERTVQRLTDKLFREGAEVINYRMMDVHAGGHAKQDDLARMINTVKARFFMPIEGNHSFLKLHAKVAKKIGYKDDQIIIADNGQIVECSRGRCYLTKTKVPSDYVFVDGLGVGDVGEIVLRDRQTMSEHGMFVVIAIFDKKTGKIKGSPDINSRGFVYLKEANELLAEARKKVKAIVEKASGGKRGKETINWVYVRDEIRERLGSFLFTKTERRPMVIPVIIEV